MSAKSEGGEGEAVQTRVVIGRPNGRGRVKAAKSYGRGVVVHIQTWSYTYRRIEIRGPTGRERVKAATP